MEIPLAVLLALSLLFLLAALAAAVAFALKWRSTRAGLQQADAERSTLQSQLGSLQSQLAALQKYRSVVDAEAHAARLLAQAKQAADQLVAQGEASRSAAQASAQAFVADATRQSAAITENARQQAERLSAEAAAERAAAHANAEAIQANASRQATAIVEAARQQAERTAGEALAAVADAKRIEQTANAMRNVIEGYGDRYVIPAAGLLDELAEEFGFAEAGQQLKAARDRVRQMIRDGSAADCDYVEANRRNTAIAFVLDAFNGKVDTVLADVRHDNHGTLHQKIDDAFALVNHNGGAFRNARITPAFRDACKQELRWAVVAQELKLRDKEQQRLIKERIREEERAQKEFERAARDAQKEEELLRKAMEKARREVELASVEQRAQLEQQLQQLTDKLRLAEEKNQRALSMAQQTRTGHVYIISNVGSFGEDVYKIGMTRRLEPVDRVRELGDASVPFEFDIHAMIPSQDAPALEFLLHKLFVDRQVNKVNPRKEFFKVSLHEIKTAVEQQGIGASWTLTAQAREYHETKAIERAIASKTFDDKTWRERQLIEQRKESLQGESVQSEAMA